MAEDNTTVARLSAIARKLEDISGVSPGALGRDTTIEANLKRIENAITGGVLEAHNLNAHTDVSVPSPSVDDFLRWNGTGWSAASVSYSLSDLTDVNDSLSPAVKQWLGFDGTEWDALYINMSDLNNVTMSALPGNVILVGTETPERFVTAPRTWSTLDDIGVAAPIDGHLAQYDGGSSQWVNRTVAAAIDHGSIGGLGDDDHIQYLLEDGSRPLSAEWDATQNIIVPTLKIDATFDHTFSDTSDELIITNPNADKSIIFSVNRTGIGSFNFIDIDGSNPGLYFLGTGAASPNIGTDGLLNVRGIWGGSIAFKMLDFQPTINRGAVAAFYVRPTIDTITNQINCFQYEPIVGTATAFTSNAVRHASTLAQGITSTVKSIEDFHRPVLSSNSGAPYTWTFRGIDIDHYAFLFDNQITYHAVGALLKGGILGSTAASASQYGLKLEGYGTIAAGTTVRAIHADGGILSWAADNAKIVIGAAEDAELYFNGSNFIIDPDPVTGAARVYIGATGDDDMLLNTIEIDGDINHDGSGVGFFGVSPASRVNAYSISLYDITTRTGNNMASGTLTDNTGGTADNTLVQISGSGDDTNINNNFADLIRQYNWVKNETYNNRQLINQIITDLTTYGLFQMTAS